MSVILSNKFIKMHIPNGYPNALQISCRWIIIVLLMLCFYIFNSNWILSKIPNYENIGRCSCGSSAENDITNNAAQQSLPIFILALCKTETEVAREDETSHSINRQLEQTTVLIKSAAVLTSSFLTFLIFSNDDASYNNLLEEVQQWPADILQRFTIQRHSASFPEKHNFQNMFRICATERLFLPRLLPEIEAAIYLDTDMIFMRPPEEIWNEFQYFNKDQMSGLAASLCHYNISLKFPYYGKTGLNSALWMMNLTRMRRFPGGWENALLKAYEQYMEHITLADQDIANIVFHENPKYVYESGCEWNYQIYVCNTGINKCPETEKKGVALLHGNGIAFYRNESMKFMTIFNIWKHFEVHKPVIELLNDIQINLKKVVDKEPVSNCSRIEGIDRILTKGLENFVQTQILKDI